MAAVGDKLKVLDRGETYDCQIMQKVGSKLEVHYYGWNGRYDEWLDEDSPRILKEHDDAVRDCGGKRKRADGDLVEDGDALSDPSRKRPSLVPGAGFEEVSSLADCTGDVQRDGGIPASEGESTPLCLTPVDVPVIVSGTEASCSPGAFHAVAAKCALCSSLIDGRKTVSCGDCGKNFHAEKLCLGVDQSVIDVLLGGDRCAVKYVCCSCRGSSRPGTPDAGMTQLLHIIGGHVSDMRKLSETVSKLHGERESSSQNGGYSSQNVGVNVNPVQVDKIDVMSEVREICEREKRKSSVILRGVGDITVQQASSIFREMCQYLELGNVSWIDIVKVAPSVFRGKITENESRFKLLAEVRKLRRSNNFRDYYIQKDLTYRQRGEVMANRAARVHNNDVEQSDGSTFVRRESLSTAGRGASYGRGSTSASGRGRGGPSSLGQGASMNGSRESNREVRNNITGEGSSASGGDNAWTVVGGRGRGRGRGQRGVPPPMTTRQSRRNNNLN